MFSRINVLKSNATSLLDTYKQKDTATYAAAQQAIGGILILDGFIGIDNPLGGKKRAGIFGSLSSVIFGVIFIAVCLFVGNIVGVNRLTATTTATVVSVGPASQSTDSNGNTSSTCPMTAHYTVNNAAYTEQASMTSSSYCGKTVGSSIAINYDPNNPGNWGADIGIFKLLLSAFTVIGGLIILGGILTFSIRLLSIVFGWKLLKSGRALAKTLPEGTNLGTVINEIRQEFSHSLFGSTTLQTIVNDIAGQPQAPPTSPTPPTIPTTPTPPASSINPTTFN